MKTDSNRAKAFNQIKLVILISLFLLSQSLSAKFKEVNIELNEKLSSMYSSEFEEIDSLKITGYFHEDDIAFIRSKLSGLDGGTYYDSHYFKRGNLCYLDLSEAKYAGIYGGSMTAWDQLPQSFGNGLAVSVLKLPKMEIDRESFSNNPYLTMLEIAPNTRIGMYSFNNCDALEKVFIPEGCVFSNTCFRGKNLLSFNVDSSNSEYKSIDGLLLDKSGKTLLAVPYGLTKIKVPDSVEDVNWAAFEFNPNIEVIQFGKNLSTFEREPFYHNPRLDRVIIRSMTPLEMKKNGSTMYYFQDCDHLKRCGYLFVPEGTKHFYEGAPGWGEIPNIIEYSPEDLAQIFDKEIEDDPYDFEYDFKVNDIYYKVTSFEDNTVGVVNGYTPYRGAFEIPEKILYNSRELTVTSIISMNNGDITNLIIPNTVTSIGGLSNNSFENIQLPPNLSELKGYVFSYCENLKSIDIPEGVHDIPSGAFYGCYKLENVNWRPNQSVSNIGPYAFFDCISLKSFTFTSNMWATGTISTSGLGYVTSFYNCTSLDSLIFEDGSDIYFGYYWEGAGRGNDCGEFYGSNITKLYLGGSYSSHAWSPGPHLGSLKELIIGDNIVEIKRTTYSTTCPPLTGLNKLVIGAQLSKINAFSADSIWVKNPTPPDINSELSNDVYINSKLYVPKGNIDIYKNAPVWKNFWNIEEMSGIEAELIVLNVEEGELKIGDTLQIEATVLPKDTTNPTVIWSSSNENIALVSEEGRVMALSVGEAVIKATCGNASAECYISIIEDAGVENIMINPETRISVFSLDGVLIKKDCKAEDLKTLSKGIYIILSGKERYKISI